MDKDEYILASAISIGVFLLFSFLPLRVISTPITSIYHPDSSPDFTITANGNWTENPSLLNYNTLYELKVGDCIQIYYSLLLPINFGPLTSINVVSCK